MAIGNSGLSIRLALTMTTFRKLSFFLLFSSRNLEIDCREPKIYECDLIRPKLDSTKIGFGQTENIFKKFTKNRDFLAKFG